MQNNQEGIIERIQKLLNLADESTNPNIYQAQEAGKKAQELLHKYQLEMSDVLKLQGKDEQIVHEYVSPIKDGHLSVNSEWRITLMTDLCLLNYCHLVLNTVKDITTGKKTKKFCVIGPKVAINVVTQLYYSLCNQFKVISDWQWEERKDQSFANGKTWKNSFMKGAVEEIIHILRMEDAVERQFNTNANALVIVNEKLVKQKVNELFPRLGNYHPSSDIKSSYDGSMAGRNAAHQVHRGNGLNASNTNKKELN